MIECGIEEEIDIRYPQLLRTHMNIHKYLKRKKDGCTSSHERQVRKTTPRSKPGQTTLVKKHGLVLVIAAEYEPTKCFSVNYAKF